MNNAAHLAHAQSFFRSAFILKILSGRSRKVASSSLAGNTYFTFFLNFFVFVFVSFFSLPFVCILLYYFHFIETNKQAKNKKKIFAMYRVQFRLLHKLLGYLSKVAPKIFKSCPKVAHFTKRLLKSCFLSTQKNQFLLLMKVNLCTSIRIIYLFIYSFLLADISIPTEMIF